VGSAWAPRAVATTGETDACRKRTQPGGHRATASAVGSASCAGRKRHKVLSLFSKLLLSKLLLWLPSDKAHLSLPPELPEAEGSQGRARRRRANELGRVMAPWVAAGMAVGAPSGEGDRGLQVAVRAGWYCCAHTLPRAEVRAASSAAA
jgi:hypothetical protein